MKIGKVFEISYAHRLMNHPGKCRGIHGHNAKIEIQIDSVINSETHMVIDFDEITQKVQWQVDELLDHSAIFYIEDTLGEEIYYHSEVGKIVVLNYHPTAEILSSLVYKIVIDNLNSLSLYKCTVRFWETENSYAECDSELIGEFPIIVEEEKEEEKEEITQVVSR